MIKDRFSIGVTFYNETIEMAKICLDSLANQSYEDVEVIAVCDGCITEGLTEYVKYYCSVHNHFRFIDLIKNSGYCIAKNVSAMLATGEYFMFMDGDMTLGIDVAQQSVMGMKMYNAVITQICVLGTGPELYTNPLSEHTKPVYRGIYLEDKVIPYGCGNIIFKTELFPKIGYMNDIRSCDLDFFARLWSYRQKNGLQFTSLEPYENIIMTEYFLPHERPAMINADNEMNNIIVNLFDKYKIKAE